MDCFFDALHAYTKMDVSNTKIETKTETETKSETKSETKAEIETEVSVEDLSRCRRVHFNSFFIEVQYRLHQYSKGRQKRRSTWAEFKHHKGQRAKEK